jgi:UDP-GlcNAc:undecaprenyl-phosphate/decaprenyl-phosphate GlcNAc-1-phosphate transferase
MVQAVLRWMHKNGILDVPNERSLHSQPTPRGGGLAIAVLLIVAWIAASLWWNSYRSPTFLGFSCSAILIATVSWLDDIRDLSRVMRFAAHSVAAGIILLTCGWVQYASLPWIGDFPLGWIGIPLTFLWIVGLTNAYNFMDGIDGIAAGQAIVAGIGWVLLGGILGEPAVTILGLVIAASSLGFLFFNWPPAKIFMGDVGSASLGFTFAFLTVQCGQTSPNGPRLTELSALFVWPFVFDSLFTFFRRLRKRENVFAAHCSHLYQRLVQSGMTHAQVSGLYIALAGVGLLPLLADYGGWKTASWCIAGGIFPLCGGLWMFTVRRETLAAIGENQPPS